MYPSDMLFTSESVTEGHPDKFCDQISDAVLDAYLARDPAAHVECTCLATMGLVMVGGEVLSEALFDVAHVVRAVGSDIGYTAPQYGFDISTSTIMRTIRRQSPDINLGVSQPGGEIGAGDQGLMFGYACRQTPELMPLPIMLAHKLALRLATVRKKRMLPYLGPDGKTLVSVEYRAGQPVRVDTVVIATQHTAEVLTGDGQYMTEDAKQQIIREVVAPVLGGLLDAGTRCIINGTGKFLIGGPQADTGLTGRKIIVDTYGGWAPHGGGAFSGKDPTKVDRSAGYMARYICKNIVAAGLAAECLLQLGYCIGVPDPVSVMVSTLETSSLSDNALIKLIRQTFPLSMKGMIEHLKLARPIYRKTAVYGHFGREEREFTWERLDAVDEVLANVKKVA